MKDGSASANIPACEDAPFEPPPLKHRKQSTRGASPGDAETRPRKKKKEGATEHSWPINEQRLRTALEEMDLEQLEQAVAATMQDVLTLPITLSERRGARNRQETYLAFSLYAIRRTGVALNQKRLRMPTRHFAKGRSCRAMVFTRICFPSTLYGSQRCGNVQASSSRRARNSFELFERAGASMHPLFVAICHDQRIG